jgi:hypothetical protein
VILPGVTEAKRHSISVIVVLLGVWMLPPSLSAQADTLAHATIRHWAEHSWLRLLDRHGSVGGRLSERGILQRFDEDIDDKYFFDRLTAAFTLREDYTWYRSENGVRWLGGSVNRRNLVSQGEFKTTVPLSEAWDIGVRFHKEDTPTARRNALRINVRDQFSGEWSGFASVHLDPNKPGTDVELGVKWGDFDRANALLSVTVMDVFNDVVYITLDAVSQSQIDSTLDYESQPFAFRTSVSWPIGHRFRVEGYGTFVTPSTLKAFEGRDDNNGFRQNERIAYAGGLAEWKPIPTFLVGTLAATIRAESEREKLSVDAPIDEYDLTEQTTQLGAFASWQVARRWLLDVWLLRVWRTEERRFRDSSIQDIDYQVRNSTWFTTMTYRSPSGFTTDVGLGWDMADEPRGEKQVPATGNLTTEHYRVRYDFGWAVRDVFQFLIGISIDIDAERNEGMSFGGGRGRFTLYW